MDRSHHRRSLPPTLLAAVLAVVGPSGCRDEGSGAVPVSSPPAPARLSTSSVPPPIDPEALARQIIDAPNARSFDSAVDGRGDLITVWSQGYHYHRRTAVAIRAASGEQIVTLGEPGARVEAALPDGWLVEGRRIVRLGADEATLVVTRSAERLHATQSGDVAFWDRRGPSVYRPATTTAYRLGSLLDPLHATGAYVTPNGALVTLVDRGDTVVVARRAGGRWTYVPLDADPTVASGGISGNGRDLVAYTTYHPAPLGDDAEDPVHAMAISKDGGRHWHAALVPPGQSVVLSTAVTRAGTGFLTFGGGRCSMVRMRTRGPASCVDVPTVQAFAAGNRVYSTFMFRGVPYRFLASDDGGDTWHPAAVPGKG